MVPGVVVYTCSARIRLEGSLKRFWDASKFGFNKGRSAPTSGKAVNATDAPAASEDTIDDELLRKITDRAHNA